MSNQAQYNVIYVDTNAGFSGPKVICGVKYIGAASGTAVITSGSADGSGNRLWAEGGTANQHVDDMDVVAKDGFYVTLTNSAKVYIYLE